MSLLKVLEGAARYAGQRQAPAEGFSLGGGILDLKIYMYPEETGGTMTMSVPFR